MVMYWLFCLQCMVLRLANCRIDAPRHERAAGWAVNMLRASWTFLPMLSLPLRCGGYLPVSFSVTFPFAPLFFGAALACLTAISCRSR
jgi:hypothetical protein